MANLTTTDARGSNILVSCAGRRAELVRILKESIASIDPESNVYAADRSPYSAAGWVSDGLEVVPEIADPAFVDHLLALCERLRIGHLVPTIDTELPVLSANRRRFDAVGTNVWVSSEETVEIARDKRRTHRWLVDRGYPTARQWDLSAVDSDTGTSALPLPLLAKPTGGSSSVGLQLIRDHAQLATLDRGVDYVLESVVPGVEFTVDVLVDSTGRCQKAVPRERLETRGGEVSKGRTVRDIGLIDLASSIAECLPGAYGILNVQIMKDVDSAEMRVIEINARVGGGFPLTQAAGCQMPLWLLEEGRGVQPSASLEWVDQQVMLRYDAAVFLDCRAAL